MKWFKHISESWNDPDIQDAIIEFGSLGYVVFFRTLEIMSREFHTDKPGENCFRTRSLMGLYHPFKPVSIQRVLKFYSDRNRFEIHYGNDGKFDTITIKCPKLKILCDEFTQKQIKKKSGQTPDSNRDKLPNKEVEVEVEVEVESNKRIKTYRPNSEEFRLSELLYSLILERDQKAKMPNIQVWAKSIDLLMRVDGRDPREVEKVIRWAQADSFWHKNILSTPKLREKFTQLKLGMEKASGRSGLRSWADEIIEEEKNGGKRQERIPGSTGLVIGCLQGGDIERKS